MFVLTTLVGCSLFVDDDLSGGPSDGVDAGDAGSDATVSNDGASEDAGPPPLDGANDAGTQSDVGPQQVTCDQYRCKVGTESCCIIHSTELNHCVPIETAFNDCRSTTGADVALEECDDDVDCVALGKTGTICCASYQLGSDYFANVQCVSANECAKDPATSHLCTLEHPECPANQSCLVARNDEARECK
jgi:hypothetical protein